MIRLKSLLTEKSYISWPNASTNSIPIRWRTGIYYNYVDPDTRDTPPNSNIIVEIKIIQKEGDPFLEDYTGFNLNNIQVIDNKDTSGLEFLGLNEGNNITVKQTEKTTRQMRSPETYDYMSTYDVISAKNTYDDPGSLWIFRLQFKIVDIHKFIKFKDKNSPWGAVSFEINPLEGQQIQFGGGSKNFKLTGNTSGLTILSSDPQRSTSTRSGGTITPGDVE